MRKSILAIILFGLSSAPAALATTPGFDEDFNPTGPSSASEVSATLARRLGQHTSNGGPHITDCKFSAQRKGSTGGSPVRAGGQRLVSDGNDSRHGL